MATVPLSAEIDRMPVVKVAVTALRDADSPRLCGTDEEYAQFLAGLETALPPIIAHRETMRVIDGMHRLRAAIIRGVEEIEVKFFEGTRQDAFVLSVRANATHGKPLTVSDRMAAATRILATHPEWSDRAIAAASGIAAKVVATIRQRATADGQQLNTRIGQDGRVRPLDYARGRRAAGELLRRNPQASLREIVREAKISLGTARDVRERVQRGEDPVLPTQRSATHETSPVVRPAVRIAAVPNEATHQIDTPDISALLNLRSDPSLRFSEQGRLLLRLLEVYAIDAGTWKRLADNLPPHCSETVADFAESCADVWRRFADQLRQRQLELA
jgi:ParB-like chromosome segregation protein Spo0J